MMLSGIDIDRAIRRYAQLNGSEGAGMPSYADRQKNAPVINIDPFKESRMNPNSYNLTLHKHLKVYALAANMMLIARHFPSQGVNPERPKTGPLSLDARKDTPTVDIEIPEEGIVLEPGVLYLGRTVEHTEAFNCVPSIEGRSSIGRLGISVHLTAGFGDVGFCGTWTLEIAVVHPVRVYAGMEVCQICYHTVSEDHMDYKGRYLGQKDPTASRLHQGDDNAD